MIGNIGKYFYKLKHFIWPSISCTIPIFQTCEQFCCSLYLGGLGFISAWPLKVGFHNHVDGTIVTAGPGLLGGGFGDLWVLVYIECVNHVFAGAPPAMPSWTSGCTGLVLQLMH